MDSAIGPISSTGSMVQWDRAPLINTSGGVLVFTSALAGTTTFQAVLSPVPEPSGFWLLASGFWLLASGFWLSISGLVLVGGMLGARKAQNRGRGQAAGPADPTA